MAKVILCLLLLLFLAGCVDKSNSIKLCKDKGFDFYKVDFGCDTVCINIETGEKHTFDGRCHAVVEYNGG